VNRRLQTPTSEPRRHCRHHSRSADRRSRSDTGCSSAPPFETEELATHFENGQSWRRLQVRYPQDIATHCREQTFYFNQKGLLQRVDYVTDVAGGVGSHYCFDHVNYDGIVIPTLRRVVPRMPEPDVFGPSAVLIQIANAIVE